MNAVGIDVSKGKSMVDRQTKNKDPFRQESESEMILYEAARNTLKAIQDDGVKLPNPNTLRAEYDKPHRRKTGCIRNTAS